MLSSKSVAVGWPELLENPLYVGICLIYSLQIAERNLYRRQSSRAHGFLKLINGRLLEDNAITGRHGKPLGVDIRNISQVWKFIRKWRRQILGADKIGIIYA